MTSDIIALIFVVGGMVGLAASVLVARRRGMAAATLLAAWSLLLIGLWLVGATRLVARIVSAVGSFVTGLVFSPLVWIGVVALGLSVVLFFVSSGLRRRRRRLGTAGSAGSVPGTAGAAAGASPGGDKPAGADTRAVSGKKSPAVDDDMAEIEEILRRRGIS